MASTYTPIQSYTLASAQATVSFNSFASTYTDLVLVVSNITTASAANSPFVRFNSDTGTNYSGTLLIGNGSTATSARRSNNSNGVPCGGYNSGSSTTEPYQFILQIQNYSNSTTYKTTLCRYGRAGAELEANVGLWRSTSAITSLEVRNDGGANFSIGCVFSLYGIKSA